MMEDADIRDIVLQAIARAIADTSDLDEITDAFFREMDAADCMVIAREDFDDAVNPALSLYHLMS